MKMLVDVVQSSMGPRREPLTFTTTTAGRIQQGAVHREAANAAPYPRLRTEDSHGRASPIPSLDRIMCLCLEPDDWEKDDEERLLSDPEIRQKITPCWERSYSTSSMTMLWQRRDLMATLGEVISKLFNVYQSATVSEWIKAEQGEGVANRPPY